MTDEMLFVGRSLFVFDELDSTNDYALSLLNKAPLPPEGTGIVARHQLSGRGQRGNKWHGERNQNMALSIILYPTFLEASRQFLLSQSVALAVCYLVNELLGQKVCYIKWPNDIFLEKYKLGGILIENTLRGHFLGSSVVGIGLNINQLVFPPHLSGAVSLRQVSGMEYDIVDLVKKLCHFIEVAYLRLKADKTADIRQSYLKNLYRLHEYVRFQRISDGFVFDGLILGVTERGELIVQMPNDEKGDIVATFGLKELQFLG